MVNLYQFSPRGTTEKAARYVISGMGDEAKSVNLLSPEVSSPAPTDVSVVAVPVYSGHIAPVILERLDVALTGGGKVIGIATYGNRDFENGLNELNEYLVRRGFEVVALIAAVGQHALVGTIAAGRPDADDAAALKDFGAKIAEKLESGSEAAFDFPKKPDIDPYALFVSPITNEDCTACGICADECPTQVIVVDDAAASPEQCLGCTHCIEVCPFEAREFAAEPQAMFEKYLGATASERRDAELFI